MVHTNRGKRLFIFIFVFYVCVYLYLCIRISLLRGLHLACMGLRVPFVLMPFEFILIIHNILIIYNYI